MDTNETIIQIKDLGFSYETEDGDKTEVLKGINLDIKRGELIAVLGHNGSGKSTLAKHLNSILVPTEGCVLVDGMDTRDDSLLYEIRRRVGMVFQNPDNQLVATIVEEDVAFAPENLGLPQDEIRKRVDFSLAAVNMSEYAHHAPHMLSGGQKQRVAVAGVLAMKPEVIVLDESTAMLDPVGRREIMDTVKRLNREEGITIIMITHFMEEAAQADRTVVINHGEIVMDDVPREVFRHVSELKKIGLDVPQTTELIHRLKKAGADMRGDILTTEECVDEIMKLYRSGGADE